MLLQVSAFSIPTGPLFSHSYITKIPSDNVQSLNGQGTQQTMNNVKSSRRNSGFQLPSKASLSPAAVNEKGTQSLEIPTVEITDATPRDYFNGPHHSESELDHDSSFGHHRLTKVSDILQKTVDRSPVVSPGSSALNLNFISSPMSSTDSLASLIERQEQQKINHPSHQHQLFNARQNVFQRNRLDSSHSIFNLLSPRRTSNLPTTKSPLQNQVDSYKKKSRKLEPNHTNPLHVHSSPNVKEDKNVRLNYDPVSKRKVLNSYELIKEIGRGEHGKVKLAREITTNELVAIKIVDRKSRPKLGKPMKQNASQEEKIRREIAIMKKINHPNVVQLKAVLDDENSRKIYLVLEYLEKGEVKWQKGPGVPIMTLPESMQVFRDVVLGLDYLHYQGIIHRDIKPANLLRGADGSVKISDFGVSFASSLKCNEQQNEYELAKTAGTPAFFAPEICEPLKNFDRLEEKVKHPKISYKIDIWALGITLYSFLFGSMPFWATNEFELFKVICEKTLEFPQEYPSNYEWTDEDKFEVKNLLFKILNKDPAKRLTIKEIKRHPLVLRNLSVEEARCFSEDQKSCEQKIEVSKDEVEVAVTGIASKLRKGIAKALKFATGYNSKSSSDFRPSHSRSNSDTKSLLNEITGSASTLEIPDPQTHRRAKSGEATSETKTTVEGDLFLNRGSVLSSLNSIMNNDRRRSSIGSSMMHTNTTTATTSTNESSTESYTNSNDSSFSKVGATLVTIPVNASFASLDSVYLDNYASNYKSGAEDAKNPRNPPQAQPPVSKAVDSDVVSQMSGFSLNKLTRKSKEDIIAPHEPAATFQFDDESDDETDEDEEESYGIQYQKIRRDTNDDQYSEFSLPSVLADELAPTSQGNSIDRIPAIVQRVPHDLKPPSASQSPQRPPNKPSYSFMGHSSDEDSEEEFETPKPVFFNRPKYSFHHDSSEDESSGEDEEDSQSLTLTFRRGRTNTLSDLRKLSPPDSNPQHTPNLSPINSHQVHLKPSSPQAKAMERTSSPLSKNAPKTPVANSSAHLANKLQFYDKSHYVNHFNKLGHFKNVADNGTRHRSSSITVGMLNHNKIDDDE